MIRCLSSSKLNMLMDIVKPTAAPEDSSGQWHWTQDPDSGAFIQVWVADDPDTPDSEGNVITVKCRAKASMTGSIRAAEQFGSQYINDEWVKIDLPFNADLTLRDRVMNIRTLTGQTLWSEEESNGNPPTAFDVFRVSPDVDGFGNLVGKTALVKKAVVQ